MLNWVIMARMSITENILVDKKKGLLTSTIKIPKYQRDATWPYRKTVKLWESISEYVQTPDSRKPDHFFYLGNLVTHQKLNLVDGQQRINAITIISSALRDVLLFLNHVDKAWDLHHNVIQTDGKNWRYKLNEQNIVSTQAMNSIRNPRVPTNLGLIVTSVSPPKGTSKGKTLYDIDVKGNSKWGIQEGTSIKCGNEWIVPKQHIHHGTSGSLSVEIDHMANPSTLVGQSLIFGYPNDIKNHDTCKAYEAIAGLFLHQFDQITCKPVQKTTKLKKGKGKAIKFAMPNDWKTPSGFKQGDVITMTSKSGTTSIKQTRNTRRFNDVYTIYHEPPGSDLSLNLGEITIPRSTIYHSLDPSLSTVTNHIDRYIDVIQRIKFGVTNFSDYSNALEHFTLANDGTRMETLYDHDLLHAMTHKFIEQLKSTGNITDADKVSELWNKEICSTILPSNIGRMESLETSKEFFGWYCLSKGMLNRGKRFDWTKLKQTDIFAEIDDYLKNHSGHVIGGFAQPSIVEFYIELSEHVFYSKVLKNPVHTVDTDAAGNDKFLDFKARALLVTLQRKTPDIFSPLIMSLFRELKNETVADRSKVVTECLMRLCYYVMRYWVISKIQHRHHPDHMLMKGNAIYGMYEIHGDGWAYTLQNVASPLKNLVSLVEKPLANWVASQLDPKVGKTEPNWPLNPIEMNFDVENHTYDGGFLLYCYQFTRTSSHDLKGRFMRSRPKGKVPDTSNHVEVEHIFPQDQATADGTNGGTDNWPHLKGKHKANYMKLGNLMLLEYYINRSFSKSGWESAKFDSTDGILARGDFHKEQFISGYTYSQWDETEISNRSKVIMNKLCAVFK